MTKRLHFKNLRSGNNTLKRISELMGISERTAKRWNKELKEGTLIREYKLFDRKSNFRSKIDREKIVKDYLELSSLLSKDKKAEGYNFSYYHKYKFNGVCSLGTFKQIMKEDLIASPNAHRKTKKYYNALLKLRLTSEKISVEKEKLINQKIDLNDKIYFRKPRTECQGEVGEMYACKDYWLGAIQSHLHASCDPAIRKITALHLEKEETTHGYYKLLEQMIHENKVPLMFKGDCCSSFVINKKNAGALAHKDMNTQFGYVLNILGIKMENSSEPTFKGAIERFFRTAQNQLKGEFRERGITTFEEAMST